MKLLRKIIIVFSAIFIIAIVFIVSSHKKYDFESVKSVRIYYIGGYDSENSTEGELSSIPNKPFDVELFRKLVSGVKFGYTWKTWKGSDLAIITLNNEQKLRLAVSHYGCFFKVPGEFGLYNVEQDQCQEWDRAFSGERIMLYEIWQQQKIKN